MLSCCTVILTELVGLTQKHSIQGQRKQYKQIIVKYILLANYSGLENKVFSLPYFLNYLFNQPTICSNKCRECFIKGLAFWNPLIECEYLLKVKDDPIMLFMLWKEKCYFTTVGTLYALFWSELLEIQTAEYHFWLCFNRKYLITDEFFEHYYKW